jgi:glycosyltransferase involved in cell wall biosynthesis
MQPLVSVIIPCYYQAKWLPEALGSLEAQTYTRWEAIIINDASPDDTVAVSKKLMQRDPRISLVDLPHNVGLCNARNAGIAKAKGTYLLPLDADDCIAPDYIEKAVEQLENDNDIKLVYGKASYFGLSSKPIDLPSFTYRQLLINNCIFNSAMVRKLDVERVGGYDINMVDGVEDWELWINLLKPSDKVYCLDEVVCYYRQIDGSRSEGFEGNLEKIIRTNKYVFQKHFEKYVSIFGVPQAWLRELVHLKKEKSFWQASFRYRFGRRFTLFLKNIFK